MIDKRKQDHIRICLEENVESGDAGFGGIRLQHRASPEINLKDINAKVTFLKKKLEFPLIFEAMTGGTPEAAKINKALASVAQEFGLGMGVGSQRAAIDDPSLAYTYEVRDVAPDILLIGNLGAVQLNMGYGASECKRAVEMIGADALALHMNSLQEAVQPEGDTNFKGLIAKMNKVASQIKTPIIAKEVGCGIDLQTARKLRVAAFDCGGVGGTSWSLVESFRNGGTMGQVGVTYASWGTPTAECVSRLAKLRKPLIASGGIRSGQDAAKAIALGADVAGVALPLLRAYHRSGQDGLRQYVKKFQAEFRTALFLTGSRNIRQIRGRTF